MSRVRNEGSLLRASGTWWGCLGLLMLSLVWYGATAVGSAAASWSATLACHWQVPTLQCRFRPLDPVLVQGVEVAMDAGAYEAVTHWRPYISSGGASAVLWLVDVSDPARLTTVAQQRALLREWLEKMNGSQYLLGLAVFADRMGVMAQLGSDTASLSEALSRVVAEGHSTAFYRSILDGLAILKNVKASRKSLWVFSDGIAEDTAYQHEDVVLAARAAEAIIVGLGYPERDSQRPQLQRLQRLAEETGGYFVTAQQAKLAPGTLTNILTVINGGGDFSLDFPDLVGRHQVTVRLLAANGSVYKKRVEIQGPPSVTPTFTGNIPPLQKQPVAWQNQSAATALAWRWWVIIGGPAVLVGMLMLWRLLRYRQSREKHTVLARLIAMDSGRELSIHTTLCRVGRAPDNELCLENDSVSAHHAELHRRRDGTFSIFDLASTNGVWVNGKPISSYSLRNDDIVELGEVRLRFREMPR